MNDKGVYNSSRTRVFPAFSILKDRLLDFFEFVNFTQRKRKRLDLSDVDWCRASVSFADINGVGERVLQPPRDLLYWMVLNAGRDNRVYMPDMKGLSHETVEKRHLLFAGDENIRMAALEVLSQGCRLGCRAGSWAILEGGSRPDVLIETNKFVFVVEGKRTEGHATDETSYFKGRDQLLRHMDAALDICNGRRVYGITIYEEGLPFKKGGFSEESIPHRGRSFRNLLESGYLAPVTWQQLQSYFWEKHRTNLGYIDKLAEAVSNDLSKRQ